MRKLLPRRKPAQPRGERLRLALEELGPIFVKFGQMLSTRRDLLPRDIADELAKLQDRVPPFAGAARGASLEARLSAARSARCSRASTRAARRRVDRAGASPRSCRTARKSSSSVRPGMRALIERDLEVLHALAHLAKRYWSERAACGPSRWCASTRRRSSMSST